MGRLDQQGRAQQRNDLEGDSTGERKAEISTRSTVGPGVFESFAYDVRRRQDNPKILTKDDFMENCDV